MVLEILYQDRRLLAAVKPFGVRSTDEPGGMPDLLRQALGDKQACVKTVHRLDQAVGGVMVFARSHEAARRLSGQIARRELEKTYLAVVHGVPENRGSFTDLLLRDKARRRTTVAAAPGKGVQEARLDYTLLERKEEFSLICIHLQTGRTHQIRVQLSHHGFPLAGDKKYGIPDEFPQIALWSHQLRLCHPETETPMVFSAPPPETPPWTWFSPVQAL